MHSDVREMAVETGRISPVVLRSTLFNSGTSHPQGRRLEMRHVYDYELEYFLYSTGAMHIDGTDHPIAKGDVCFRRPGELVCGIMPYNCILICFDLLGDTGKDPVTYDFNVEQPFQPFYRNPVLDAIPSVFHPQGEGIRALFETILKLHLSQEEGALLQIRGCMLHLLNRIYQEVKTPLHADAGIRPAHLEAVRDVVAHVREHLSESLCLEDLAALTAMSPAHFHKVFSAVMHETLNAHITRLRLEKARECLIQNDWPVNRVAAACGYENPAYFSYVFRKAMGETPLTFKRRHRYA